MRRYNNVYITSIVNVVLLSVIIRYTIFTLVNIFRGYYVVEMCLQVILALESHIGPRVNMT